MLAVVMESQEDAIEQELKLVLGETSNDRALVEDTQTTQSHVANSDKKRKKKKSCAIKRSPSMENAGETVRMVLIVGTIIAFLQSLNNHHVVAFAFALLALTCWAGAGAGPGPGLGVALRWALGFSSYDT